MKLIRNNNLIYRNSGNKIIIFDHSNGKITSLNASGSIIWRYLYKPRTLEDIIYRISTHYKFNLKKSRTDVSSFINNCLKEGILKSI